MLKKILFALPALIYITVVKIRHKLFDWGVLSSRTFITPTICVGNITVGGSGKTPIVELLIEELSKEYSVALLSRGYGRATRGYVEASVESDYLDVGDEPLQIKRKFPHSRVVVCERRVKAIEQIERMTPKVDLIVMDDGFQHRYVQPAFNIVVIDSTRPVAEDFPMPMGSLRDCRSALKRADLFVVTKCSPKLSHQERDQFRASLSRYGSQPVVFTRIANGTPLSVFGGSQLSNSARLRVVALSGIGNPAPFVEKLQGRYNVVEVLSYADHYSYRDRDLARLERLIDDDTVIVTTEKDSVKFLTISGLSELIRSRLYYLPMSMELIEGGSIVDHARSIGL
ncbi:MAG: tetraacyldisaccharide 4'-kinase [Rikenellaceae bacterium]